MNKQKTLRYVLVAAIAGAVSIPLISQVRNSQAAREQEARQAANAQQALPAGPAAPETALPAVKHVEVDPKKVVASYGDIRLTAGDFEAVMKQLGPKAEMVDTQPALKKQLAQNLLQVKVLAAEAEHRKLDEDPEIKRQLAFSREQVLAQALEKSGQGGADDKGDRAYFDANKSQFDKMKARHILIRTPGSPVPLAPGQKEMTDAQAKAKADEIEKQLANKGDFATIAKAESDDKGSGLKGGDLGSFSAWNMDTTFAKAAQALQPNQISAPIKTRFGYHVIELLEDKPQTFEEAKSEVGQARLQQLVAGMAGGAHFDSAFFGLPPEPNDGPATRPAATTEAPAQPQGKKGA